jgi:hypothetical protein
MTKDEQRRTNDEGWVASSLVFRPSPDDLRGETYER